MITSASESTLAPTIPPSTSTPSSHASTSTSTSTSTSKSTSTPASNSDLGTESERTGESVCYIPRPASFRSTKSSEEDETADKDENKSLGNIHLSGSQTHRGGGKHKERRARRRKVYPYIDRRGNFVQPPFHHRLNYPSRTNDKVCYIKRSYFINHGNMQAEILQAARRQVANTSDSSQLPVSSSSSKPSSRLAKSKAKRISSPLKKRLTSRRKVRDKTAWDNDTRIHPPPYNDPSHSRVSAICPARRRRVSPRWMTKDGWEYLKKGSICGKVNIRKNVLRQPYLALSAQSCTGGRNDSATSSVNAEPIPYELNSLVMGCPRRRKTKRFSYSQPKKGGRLPIEEGWRTMPESCITPLIKPRPEWTTDGMYSILPTHY